MNKASIAYISFDTVPAPKGAAIHITAFARALAKTFGEIDLVTVSTTKEATCPQEIWPNVIQTQLPAIGDTLINRVLFFRTMLRVWMQNKRYRCIHFRSIFEGFPIAINKDKLADKLIFEVNGLPSIELKYRYPQVGRDRELLYKIYKQEKICLEAADLIVTPSSVTKEYLQAIGVEREKICAIPNGVDLEVFTYRYSPVKTGLRLLYFGTFSAWQGVNLAIDALGLINRDRPAELTLIGSARPQQIAGLKQLAARLKVLDKLTILSGLSQQELVEEIHRSDVVLAPLTASDRNLVQGCCPLKVLEGMATGVPVIASDLPAVRELGINGEHFLLVKPASSKGIKDAVFRLADEPELAKKLAINARRRIEENYTWQKAGDALIAAYQKLGIGNRE